MGLSLAVVGKKIGVSASAVQSWEKGKAKPKYAHAKALSAVLDIDIAEILNDPSHIAAPHARSEPDQPTETTYEDVCGPSPYVPDEDSSLKTMVQESHGSYACREDVKLPDLVHKSISASPPRHPAAAIMPGPVYPDSGIDPVIQAMSDIKDIFNSGDPILVPAIQANLSAFKRALLREQQFIQVMEENKELKERIARLEALCGKIPELEAKIESLQAENQALREVIG